MNIFSKVVLVVDDSPTVRRMLEWSLKPLGCRTLQAGDGVEAFELLKRQTVDLVIADINMPRMDGIELIKAIRADEYLKPLPIVLLTTEKRDEDMKMGLEAGANIFLNKPLEPVILRRKVEALLGIGGAARR